MATITTLNIQRFRNLTAVDINTPTQFNLFYGNNGAGKTSLLEAIHYLSTGRSFRIHLFRPLIQRESNSFSIFAQMSEPRGPIPLGVERHRNGDRHLKLDGDAISSWAPLASQVPVRTLSAMTHRFLLDGAKIRRQFTDWMVFHVEQTFIHAWQRFQSALKQRNAALKARLSKEEIRFWDETLVSSAEQIHLFREKTISAFEPHFQALADELLPKMDLRIRYDRGWNPEKTLGRLLVDDLFRDLQFGFTHSGPHRADLRLLINGTPAQEVLSQGQQKLATYALHLAQGRLLQKEHDKNPIYLLDDLSAELDAEKRDRVIDLLRQFSAQVFITGTSEKDLAALLGIDGTSLFHVEHGTVQRRLG